jgi:hypothetical protein
LVRVVKASGEREEFDPQKFLRSIMRGGSSKATALKVLDSVESRLHENMPTKEIYQMASAQLSRYDKRGSLAYGLKGSIMRLGPSGFPFEGYVGAVLSRMGYEVSVGNTAHGRCVNHEIDVIAVRRGKATMVECKYHNYKGVYTGLKEAMYTYARLLDIREGYAVNHIGAKIESAMLVTNTKFSEDAIAFSECRGIELLGWKYPERNSLERIVDTEKLFPLTILPRMTTKEAIALSECGLILVKDLLRFDLADIHAKTRIPVPRLASLSREAHELLD